MNTNPYNDMPLEDLEEILAINVDDLEDIEFRIESCDLDTVRATLNKEWTARNAVILQLREALNRARA